ncbi:hypothetical protein FHW23_001593 [Curtobacterium pusillum]|uniref:Uncharacterized protein n=1 Tax=Curtobacterium pusillum TaxID=69373 RepID=A0AAW3T716_9MICO|nr:hypothetical protein [Curtobacterium pusillum]MBA8990347.1 hypothetical protein [Curtobacterium pusillum]
MSVRRKTTACGVLRALTLVVAGCASGIQPRDDSEVDYSLDARLSGTLDTMGFGLGDDVHVPMAQGALDTQAFLSTLAADEGITTTGTKG